MLFRTVWAAALVLAPIAANALSTCNPDTQDCSRFAACVQDTAEVFHGVSFGRDAGPLEAETEAGVQCSGQWHRGPMGVGIAEFSCSDGRSGNALYTWIDPDTGTARGKGQFSDGTAVWFWAGNDLGRYFASADPDDLADVACTPAEMLFSGAEAQLPHRSS